MPPSACAPIYGNSSELLKRPPTSSPTETAGFKWQPEMWPIAYAIVSTVRPKANETPSRPMPTLGKAAASTALPQPPNTNQKVPRNSAVQRLLIDTIALLRSKHNRGGMTTPSAPPPQLVYIGWRGKIATRRRECRGHECRSDKATRPARNSRLRAWLFGPQSAW